MASSYFDNICRDDTYNIDSVKRDSKIFESILRSYSRNISTLVNNTRIMVDIEENYGKISEPTFYSYISVLKTYLLLKMFLHGLLIFVQSKNKKIRKKNS